jgi:hypothetical protein
MRNLLEADFRTAWSVGFYRSSLGRFIPNTPLLSYEKADHEDQGATQGGTLFTPVGLIPYRNLDQKLKH